MESDASDYPQPDTDITSLIPSQSITTDHYINTINDNYRENHDYGDSYANKDITDVRFWLQNPNGIAYTKTQEDLQLHL
eukprot:5146424-Ditylum_brightwellii.AAC.1